MRAWTPVIEAAGPLRARAAILLEKITAEAIANGGLDGVLLLAHRGATEGNPVWLNRAVDHLNTSIDQADALYSMRRFELFGGLAGLGWTIGFVMRQLGRAQETGRLNEDIGAALLQELQRGRWNGPCGLATGLAGVGVYFQQALPDARAKFGLDLVRAHLRDAASRSRIFEAAGVAEGAGGVLGLIEPAQAEARTFGPKPCSWWDGELGVAAVAVGWAPGTLAPRIDALERCLAWAPERENDASLLRGAAGTAHLWSRLYGSTGDARSREASLGWWQRAITLLETAAPAGNAAGAPFLAGAAGIGLALSSALLRFEPEWDVVLGLVQPLVDAGSS
jgi:hypothetical protein